MCAVLGGISVHSAGACGHVAEEGAAPLLDVTPAGKTLTFPEHTIVSLALSAPYTQSTEGPDDPSFWRHHPVVQERNQLRDFGKAMLSY